MQYSPTQKLSRRLARRRHVTGATARKRFEAARRQVYRQLIMDAAEAVFAEHGFADAKMSDIAREAGVALKTLYAAFKGKAELYHCIHELRCEEMLTLADEPAVGSALEAAMEHVRVTVEYFLEHPSFLRTHLREGNAWAVGPALKAATEIGLWQKNMKLAADIVRRGIEEGLFVDEDPDLMTKMSTAVYQVHLADWLDRETASNDARDSAELVARIQRHVSRLLCRVDPA